MPTASAGAQELVVDVEHANPGTIQLPGPPLRSGNAGREEPPPHQAPSTLGEHDETVRVWLDGLTEHDTGRHR